MPISLARAAILRPKTAAGGGAIPTFVGVGATDAIANPATNISPGIPAGAQLNDLLMIHAEVRDTIANSSIATPSDWTPQYADGGAEVVSQFVFTKFHDGSESAPVLDWDAVDVNRMCFARIYAFRGVGAGIKEGGGVNHGTATNPAISALTTTGPNRLGIVLMVLGTANENPGDAAAHYTELTPEAETTVGGDGFLGIWSAGIPSATTLSATSINLSIGRIVTVRNFALVPT